METWRQRNKELVLLSFIFSFIFTLVTLSHSRHSRHSLISSFHPLISFSPLSFPSFYSQLTPKKGEDSISLADGESLHGTVAVRQTNYYKFTVNAGKTIKLFVDRESSSSNTWNHLGSNSNNIVIYRKDPFYKKGEYYVGVEGWYSHVGSVNYKITVFYL